MSISQNYPNISPSLSLDFANVKALDPRIAFTRASTGTFYDANGLLRTADANVARFQFDPDTYVSEGLLVEEQRTNLVLRSEEFDNAAWTKFNTTVEPNVLIAPDGTLTCDKLVENTATAIHFLTINGGIFVTSGTSYTFTVFAKAASTKRLGFATSQTGWTTNRGAIFDLNAGTISDIAASTTATITDVGNGFYRCAITATATSTVVTNINFSINNGTSSLFPSYAGNGFDGIFIWGAQLEEAAFPTSYIKTVASQVTRAADTAILTNVDAYNTAEFTAVSKPFGVSGVSATQTVLNGDVPIERLYVYPRNISQNEINTLVENDGYWSWRIVGADFALLNFTTNGTVIVDWGDGTEETLTTAVHTFTNASPHTVRFRMGSGTFFGPTIFSNATHANKVIAVGSVPSNMLVDCNRMFAACSNLKSIDATLTGQTSFLQICLGCTSLVSFPFVNSSNATSFQQGWSGCTSLSSFPLIDASSVINFFFAWNVCSGLTSFPLLDTSSGSNFQAAFANCSSLTSFPLINVNLGTNFINAWFNCSSLTDFPANMFDSLAGVPGANCFLNTWAGTTALTTTSVENILVSIDTSGVSAPATGTEITIVYNVATGALTAPTTAAITSLQGKSWTIRINGVVQ